MPFLFGLAVNTVKKYLNFQTLRGTEGYAVGLWDAKRLLSI